MIYIAFNLQIATEFISSLSALAIKAPRLRLPGMGNTAALLPDLPWEGRRKQWWLLQTTQCVPKVKRDSEEQEAKGAKVHRKKAARQIEGLADYCRSQQGLKGKDSAEGLNNLLSFRVYWRTIYPRPTLVKRKYCQVWYCQKHWWYQQRTYWNKLIIRAARHQHQLVMLWQDFNTVLSFNDCILAVQTPHSWQPEGRKHCQEH